MRLVVTAALLLGVQSASVANCGGTSDHFKNVVYTVTPDPIVKGKAITLNFSGDLDEDLTGGSAVVDLSVKALGVINKQLKGNSPFSISPALAKGPSSVTVGPFSLPRDLPGSLSATGTLKLVNEKNEPIACVSLDIDIPLLENVPAPVADLAPPSSCGKPKDHLQNLNINVDASKKTTITGSLDEIVSVTTINVDLKVHEIFNIPVKLSIPLTYKPGFPKGNFTITAGPPAPSDELQSDLLGLSISGSVSAVDGNQEEILCLNVATPSYAMVAGPEFMI